MPALRTRRLRTPRYDLGSRQKPTCTSFSSAALRARSRPRALGSVAVKLTDNGLDEARVAIADYMSRSLIIRLLSLKQSEISHAQVSLGSRPVLRHPAEQVRSTRV